MTTPMHNQSSPLAFQLTDTVREAWLDGKRVRYDHSFTCDHFVEKAKECLEYLGSGYVVYVDGERTMLDKETHFFKRKS